jgi:hypothetical protein
MNSRSMYIRECGAGSEGAQGLLYHPGITYRIREMGDEMRVCGPVMVVSKQHPHPKWCAMVVVPGYMVDRRREEVKWV